MELLEYCSGQSPSKLQLPDEIFQDGLLIGGFSRQSIMASPHFLQSQKLVVLHTALEPPMPPQLPCSFPRSHPQSSQFLEVQNEFSMLGPALSVRHCLFAWPHSCIPWANMPLILWDTLLSYMHFNLAPMVWEQYQLHNPALQLSTIISVSWWQLLFWIQAFSPASVQS